MALTYTVALMTGTTDSLVPVPGVKFAGDKVVSITVVSGGTTGTDITSAFGSVAPASGWLAQLTAPVPTGTTCIATLETTQAI